MRSTSCLLPFLILLLVTLFTRIAHVHAFIQLFFQHSGIAITQEEIASAYSTNDLDVRPQLIPKIIHQVYHNWRSEAQNDSMPEDWQATRRTCLDFNRGWKSILWTNVMSRDLIKEHYPWFLDTYDGYKYAVQRVDAIKYFALLHYGGIYLDLDNGCLNSLEPLLYLACWTTDGGRGALSNNIFGTVPNHPFWQLLTNSLISYDYNYLFPYITISYASGQWFETAIWQKYHAALASAPDPLNAKNRPLHRIMMDDRPGTPPWIFFTQMRGGSWVNWDNAMFLWIGDHLMLLAVGVGALLALLGRVGMRKLSRGSRSWTRTCVPLITDNVEKADNV